MFIAVDDTDSIEGMCTTFLLTEIIRRSGLDIIGYPRLVRLNPAIQYKTRGNGALAVNLGIGCGESKVVGKIGGKDILSYAEEGGQFDPKYLLSTASEVINELAMLEESGTNPGIVISNSSFPEEFYWKAVNDSVSIEEAEGFIKRNGGEFLKFKNGRGIIGAAASLSWPNNNRTYEVLAYRNGENPNLDISEKLKIAECAEHIEGSFNNIDRLNKYAAIFPKERTPVLAGVRGIDSTAILKEFGNILHQAGIEYDRILCYETNQATDDHILTDYSELTERRSYMIEGMVASNPVVISGSHYFSSISSKSGVVGIAAFEPTKEFRQIFGRLAPGDYVRVFGSFINGTLNVEKMEILDLSSEFRKQNPNCTICGKRMVNNGIHDYRCKQCKTRKSMPHYSPVERNLETGRYDVPVIARRHLSKPFDFTSGNALQREAEVY